MSTNAKISGDLGEDFAVRYLKKHRYKIIARNYRKRYGEIDIIAENKNYLIFVEVKTRGDNPIIGGAYAVDKRKQARIIKTAAMYLMENPTNKYCRFDVCEVYIDSKSLKLKSLNYIENAFEQEGYNAAY